MSFWRGLAIGMILAWVCSSRAELVRIRVKVLNASEVSDEYLATVVDRVRRSYRTDLRVRTRFAVHKSSVVDHSQFISLEDRAYEFIAYSKLLRRPRWNRVTFVAVPPYWDDQGRDYGTGLATWFAMGVLRGVNWLGEDRYNSDWVTLAHEVAHVLGATHIDRKPNIMHSAALQFTPTMDLKFLKQTRKEINL